jgi:hypothetical protein
VTGAPGANAAREILADRKRRQGVTAPAQPSCGAGR